MCIHRQICDTISIFIAIIIIISIPFYFTFTGILRNVPNHSLSSLTNTWWRHQMEKLSALLALCAGNSPVTSEYPSQRPVTCSFDVFFDLSRNKWLSKQSWGWWFEMPSHSLCHHCNDLVWLIYPDGCVSSLNKSNPTNCNDFTTFELSLMSTRGMTWYVLNNHFEMN